MNIAQQAAAAMASVQALIEARAAEAHDALARDFARIRVQHNLRPRAIRAGGILRLPIRFECPECGGRLLVEVDEWSSADGTPTAGGYRVMCEPDTEAEIAAWNRDENYYGHRHWQCDWEHLQARVGRWMVRNVRVVA